MVQGIGWVAFCFVFAASLLGCQREEPAPQPLGETVQMVVDALEVRAKSVAQVDSLLGEPADTFFVAGHESGALGQARLYGLEQAKVTVEFHHGMASQLVVAYAASDVHLAVEVLRMVGLEEENLNPALPGAAQAPVWTAPQAGLDLVMVHPGTPEGAIFVRYEGGQRDHPSP